MSKSSLFKARLSMEPLEDRDVPTFLPGPSGPVINVDGVPQRTGGLSIAVGDVLVDQFTFFGQAENEYVTGTGLTGFDADNSKLPWFEMRHAPSGVRVKVEGNYAFAKLNVWGIKTTICPEPYMAIDLKPGESKEWLITYTFVHDPPALKK